MNLVGDLLNAVAGCKAGAGTVVVAGNTLDGDADDEEEEDDEFASDSDDEENSLLGDGAGGGGGESDDDDDDDEDEGRAQQGARPQQQQQQRSAAAGAAAAGGAAAAAAAPEAPKGRSAIKAAERAAMGAEAYDRKMAAERAKKAVAKRGGAGGGAPDKPAPAGGRTGGGGRKGGGGGADDTGKAKKRADRVAVAAAVVTSRNEKKTLAALAAAGGKPAKSRLIEAFAPSSMDAASAAHVRALGLGPRNRVLAALYMARCDLSAVVRQARLGLGEIECGRRRRMPAVRGARRRHDCSCCVHHSTALPAPPAGCAKGVERRRAQHAAHPARDPPGAHGAHRARARSHASRRGRRGGRLCCGGRRSSSRRLGRAQVRVGGQIRVEAAAAAARTTDTLPPFLAQARRGAVPRRDRAQDGRPRAARRAPHPACGPRLGRRSDARGRVRRAS